MNYKKVKQTELEGLTQKEGEDLLFAAGYVKDDDYSDRDEYKVGKYSHIKKQKNTWKMILSFEHIGIVCMLSSGG